VDFSDFTFISEPGRTHVHLAHTRQILPICPCLCKSPGMRRKTGDCLCRCPCHGLGPHFATSLCGQTPNRRWTLPKRPSKPTCQLCHAYACHPPPPPPAKCGVVCGWILARRPVACDVPLVMGEHIGLHSGIQEVVGGEKRVSW
jgi:hypothetical protein